MKVPVYTPNVSLRPNLRQDIQQNITPDQAGAAVGRGLQGLGKGMSDLADAAARVQALEDTTRAKEADNAYANWVRERQYGEGGYMTLEGRNAVDGRAAFDKEAEEKRKEFGAGLSGGAARKYHSASTARLQSAYQSSITHQARERKTWVKEASSARLSTFADDAVVNFDKPALAQKAMAAGVLELRDQGALQGWDADTLKDREQQYVSGVHRNITLRIAQDDPIAADAYMKQNKGQITGKDQYALEKGLERELKIEHSKREADAILQAGRRPPAPASRRAGETGPTNTRAFLIDRLVAGHGKDHVDGLDENFAVNLGALIQDAPPEIAKGLGILSGHRTVERQKELWDDALKKYGSAEAARKRVAPPGRSKHNHGQAVDLAYNGRSLKHAPQEVIDWVHQNAGKYGLHFPMAHENWHIEPVGARGGGGTVAPRSGSVASRSVMPSYGEIEDRLSNIRDSDVRDLTRKRLYAALEAQSKAEIANERAAKAELWKHIDAGKSPDEVPMEIRNAAGMAAVSAAWSYMETESRGRAVDSDETLLYGMRRRAAADPLAFADVDLNDYRDRLSKQHITELTKLQTEAIGGSRKAREDGIGTTAAFSQASRQLAAVGITETGKKGTDREKAAKRIAQFQNALADQMDEFRRANKKAPERADVQAMINRLLLPIVVSTPGSIFGNLWPNTEDARMFEAGNRPDGSSVDVTVKYDDIPIDLRRGISGDLERELGRKPSQEEITTRYEAFVLNR